jgi:RHS repeat-associated protein
MSNYGFTSAGTSYDDEDRLTGFARASGTFTQSWSLTSVGDWNSITTNGTAQNRTHGPTHELLTAGGQSVKTDPKGNITLLPAVLSSTLTPQTSRLSYDFDNKLKSADVDNNGSNDVTFQYDAPGRRVARQGTSGSFVYVQHDQQTIADYGYGDAPSSPTHRYVYASYIDEPVVRKAAGTSGTIYYLHRNQQYSITAVTTSSGSVAERYAYTAYGQPTILDGSGSVLSSSAINNRYTYTGREWDATLGLYHFRARWMSGLAGRFMGRDPIGFDGGLNFNASSLQLSKVDPSGRETIRFEFNAFINGNRGTWLPEPGTSNFWDREFKSDGRGFGEVGTSRMSTQGSIESCAIGLGSPSASSTSGASHLRRRRLQLHPCTGVPCAGEWDEFESTASLDIDEIKGNYSKPPCKSTIRIKASAGYPFVPFSPNIDYDVTFTFWVSGKDTVVIEFSGTHNKFPDYEAILVKGSNRQVIYSRQSPDSGPTPGNLNSSVSAK